MQKSSLFCKAKYSLVQEALYRDYVRMHVIEHASKYRQEVPSRRRWNHEIAAHGGQRAKSSLNSCQRRLYSVDYLDFVPENTIT